MNFFKRALKYSHPSLHVNFVARLWNWWNWTVNLSTAPSDWCSPQQKHEVLNKQTVEISKQRVTLLLVPFWDAIGKNHRVALSFAEKHSILLKCRSTGVKRGHKHIGEKQCWVFSAFENRKKPSKRSVVKCRETELEAREWVAQNYEREGERERLTHARRRWEWESAEAIAWCMCECVLSDDEFNCSHSFIYTIKSCTVLSY